MALEDKIKALQEAAMALKASKKSDIDSDDSDDSDDCCDDEIEDGSEDETKSKKDVKEATDPNQSQAATDQTTDDVATKNAKIKRKAGGQDPQPKMKPGTVKEAIDLGSLFDGVELTEEFKEKATTIFEAAVSARVSQIQESLEEELALRALTESEELKEGLVEKVDGYLDFIVEQWMKNNEIALERGIKAEIFESFIDKMKDVFVEHNINLPDDEFSLVESLQEKVEAIEETLDEQVAQNIELNKIIKQYAKQTAIDEATNGMTDIDAEKFALLSEEIQFDDEESFTKKLAVIAENYVSNKGSKKEVKELTEDVTQDSNAPVGSLNEEVKRIDPAMAQYVKAIK
jgi:ABC-type uncharacterized transport system ATPase subunit